MNSSLPTVGILGANGFIGSRVVELLHLRSLAVVRPIVHTLSSAARSSRFPLSVRISDGFDEAALRQAVDGCDFLIHAITGDRRTILGTLITAYRAAHAAGVKRLVYLSSASVHGQAPAVGTFDESPLSSRQPIAYNNAKVLAERKLRQLRARGNVEIVILRPGIVFGPRSYWTAELADELLSGQAYFVESNIGICNSLYVDNLVHAIYLAAMAPKVDGNAFLVGDRETVTWLDFYRPLMDSLGIEPTQIPILPFPEKVRFWRDPYSYVRSSEMLSQIVSSLPSSVRNGLRTLNVLWRQRRSVHKTEWTTMPPANVVPSLERALLHRCQYKFPWTKAATLLGYEPEISFEEGCRRSIAWLEFAGFPVVQGGQRPSRT
jgi:nucleoside-diphosphate-sugar epimerase